MGAKLTVSAAMAALSLSFTAEYAAAQKSKDTIRVALTDSVSIVDPITNAAPVYEVLGRAVIGSLISYDWDAKKYVPSHATAWRMINDKTLEYDLRDDIVFQDGSKFDADDVVDSFNYILDPGINFPYKTSYVDGLTKAEKVGPYKVRFHSTIPLATILYQTGERFRVVPSDRFVGKKDTFGQMPVGSGPFEAVQVDGSKGVIFKKYNGYRLAGPSQPAAKIGRAEVKFIPDMQSQAASMLVGQLDLINNVDRDVAGDLIKNPELRLDTIHTLAINYILFDAADRSGVGVFKDQRVRQAVSMAVDRQKLGKLLVPEGATNLEVLDNLCPEEIYGCAGSAKPLPYQPAKAKQLLAEAGLKDGFELKISTFGPTKDLATAVAGDLRAVGIRASIEYLSTPAYLKNRREGKVQMIVAYYNNGAGQSDASASADFFFAPGDRDYAQDPALHDLLNKSSGMVEIDQRRRAYQELFDTAINKNYLYPLLPLPTIIVHHKDVVVEKGPRNGSGYQLNYLRWAD